MLEDRKQKMKVFKMDYPSCLKDEEWDLIKNEFVRKDKYGNRRKHNERILLDAIFYLLDNGCKWRSLPINFPPWKTVYSFRNKIKEDGAMERILKKLNSACRRLMEKSEKPHRAIIDSQSTKGTNCTKDIGFDGNKKVKGRKKQIVVDSQGFLLHAKCHKANIHDTKMGSEVLTETVKKYPSINTIIADQGYLGTTKNFVQKNLKKKS